jgi:hypothetical protein
MREFKCSRMQVQRAREPSAFVFISAFLFSVGQAGERCKVPYFGSRLLPEHQRLEFRVSLIVCGRGGPNQLELEARCCGGGVSH